MYRRIIILLLVIVLAIFIGYIGKDSNVLETFLSGSSENETVETTSNTENSTEILTTEIETTEDTTYDFISFASEHVLDIEPILQMPEFPTGCESVSLTMALNYITCQSIDPGIVIDNYLPKSDAGEFVNTFFGDPRSTDGGGCYPPAILKAANDYFKDNDISLYALDATGINAEQIKHYIDNGFPILIWTTMYMGKPQLNEMYQEYNGTTYQWYTSEHCVLIKGYDPEKNVFIINDPLIGEVERDIDKFMEISDLIGNLAAIIL